MTHSTPGWERDKLISIVVEAGRYAHSRQETLETDQISLKSDQTLVTAIDTAVEAMVSTALLDLRPGSHVIGEETVRTKSEEYLTRALAGECWVIDPIDGTAPFASGFDTWGVSVGYMVNGVILEGVVYLPSSGLLFVSDQGGVWHATIGDQPTEEVTVTPLQRRTPRHSRGIISISQDLACHGHFNASKMVQSVGSCVYSAAQYLYGRYAGIITNVKLWDIAAGVALLRHAGHTILLGNSEEVRQDTTHSSFLLSPQTDPNRRWGMHQHIFIAPSATDCQRLIDTTTYPMRRIK